MSKAFSKKHLFLCLAISLALLVAGAFVFGFLGFSEDSTVRDETVVRVNGFVSQLSEEDRDEFIDFCENYIESEGYGVITVRYARDTSWTDGACEFVIAASADAYEQAELDALSEGLDTAIGTLTSDQIPDIETWVDLGIHVTVVESENTFFADYAWRAAVAGAAVLVIAFAYAAIRFRPGMGLGILVGGVHDVLLTLALIALFRLPVGVTLIAVAAFSLLTSLLFNFAVFGRMRSNFRSEDWKELPAREAVARSVKESRRTVFTGAIVLAAVAILIGVVGVVLGLDLAYAMIGGLLAVIVSAYSSLLFVPALFAAIKARTDKRRAERAKYDYVSDRERKKREKAEKQAVGAEE